MNETFPLSNITWSIFNIFNFDNSRLIFLAPCTRYPLLGLLLFFDFCSRDFLARRRAWFPADGWGIIGEIRQLVKLPHVKAGLGAGWWIRVTGWRGRELVWIPEGGGCWTGWWYPRWYGWCQLKLHWGKVLRKIILSFGASLRHELRGILHKALQVWVAFGARLALYKGIAWKRRIGLFHGGHHEWWSHWEYSLHLRRGLHGLCLLDLSLWFVCRCGSVHLLPEAGIPHTSSMTIGDFDIRSYPIPIDLPYSSKIRSIFS